MYESNNMEEMIMKLLVVQGIVSEETVFLN